VTQIPVSLAAEGLLDEHVLRCLLEQSGQPYAPGVCYGKRGRAHLAVNVPRFNRAAIHQPFVILADLDRDECSPALVRRWLPDGNHPNLVLRIAVREVEAWLLADRQEFAAFLGVALAQLPSRADEIEDPKLLVVSLARHSRYRSIRDDVAPAPGSTSSVGRNYTAQLARFVLEHWLAERARENSPSLDRALRALGRFFPSLPV
jgi:hypothetical protein